MRLASLTLSPPPRPPQLYSELRSENERLREALTETTLRLAQLKVELERAAQVRRRGPGGFPALAQRWPRCACAGAQDPWAGGQGLRGVLGPVGVGLDDEG